MPMDIQGLIRRLTTLAQAAGVGTALFDAAGRRLMQSAPESLCGCVCATREGLRRCEEFHRDAGQTAWQSGPYITRCHAGAVALIAPLTDGGSCAGSAACLPLRLDSRTEAAETDLLRVCHDLPLTSERLRAVGRETPVVDESRARALLALLGEVIAQPAADAGTFAYRQALDSPQQRLDQLLLARADDPEGGASPRPHDYPIQLEREMLGRVRLGDKSGARAMLNELLAHIFLRSPGNMELIKARLLELVVMISRAAVESGAELDRLLGLNYNFISEAAEIQGFEELTHWVVKVLDTFLDTVYESRSLAGSRQLTDALSYIRSHHMQNLTLEDVAAQVYVSPYYLSHMFKEKLGVTFVEYLTRVRVEMAKNYLLNTQLPVAAIAERVGYEDAGYFGKVFKRLTGATPKQFRRGD